MSQHPQQQSSLEDFNEWDEEEYKQSMAEVDVDYQEIVMS